MNKNLMFAIQFANLCRTHNIEPRELAELVVLIKRAFKAGEHDANFGTDTADKWYDKVKTQAATFGFQTQWPGLYPSFTKDNKPIHVPCEG